MIITILSLIPVNLRPFFAGKLLVNCSHVIVCLGPDLLSLVVLRQVDTISLWWLSNSVAAVVLLGYSHFIEEFSLLIGRIISMRWSVFGVSGVRVLHLLKVLRIIWDIIYTLLLLVHFPKLFLITIDYSATDFSHFTRWREESLCNGGTKSFLVHVSVLSPWTSIQ